MRLASLASDVGLRSNPLARSPSSRVWSRVATTEQDTDTGDSNCDFPEEVFGYGRRPTLRRRARPERATCGDLEGLSLRSVGRGKERSSSLSRCRFRPATAPRRPGEPPLQQPYAFPR